MKTSGAIRLLSVSYGALCAAVAACILAGVIVVWTSLEPRCPIGPRPVTDYPRALAAREMVDPNTASAASLKRLPGLGSKRAARIVEHREMHGPFTKPEDLLEVKDVGPWTLEGIKPYICFKSQ